MNSNFHINHKKYQSLEDQALGWFIKSWKYPVGSDEWKICRLKQSILRRQALKHLGQIQEALHG